VPPPLKSFFYEDDSMACQVTVELPLCCVNIFLPLKNFFEGDRTFPGAFSDLTFPYMVSRSGLVSRFSARIVFCAQTVPPTGKAFCRPFPLGFLFLSWC